MMNEVSWPSAVSSMTCCEIFPSAVPACGSPWNPTSPPKATAVAAIPVHVQRDVNVPPLVDPRDLAARAYSSRFADANRLRALPEGQPPELPQPFATLDDRGEMVPRQLSGLAREAAVAVGE